MFNMITNKVYQGIIIGLVLVIAAMGINTWLDNKTITALNKSLVALEKDIKEEQAKLAASLVNEYTLQTSLNAQNIEVEGLRIDLDKAKKQYRIEEKRIYETIFAERVVLKDLNDSEDWDNTKRIVNEIINLKF